MKHHATLSSGFARLRRAQTVSTVIRSALRAFAIAAITTLASAPEAEAQDTPVPNGPVGLKRVGPVNAYNGFPFWYEDTTGLKLGVCQDPNNCFFGANPLAPVTFPQSVADAVAGNFNYPDEVFFYAIENLEITRLPSRARVMYHVAIEGAFASGDVMPGQQVVFARLRIRLRDVAPESLYTIRHPYGEEVLESEPDGSIFYTRDIGLSVGNFGGAVYGDIGPFLVPTGFNRNSPKGTLLSNGGLTLETVEGSPIGRNYVEYEGPGLGALFPALVVDPTNPDRIRSSLFAMQGQVAEKYGVGIDDAYYSATGNAATSTLASSVTVHAQSAEGQNMIVRAQDGSWAPMQENTNTPGHYFAKVDLGETNSALPSDLEVRNVSDAPFTSKAMATIPDLVSVQSATFTLGQNGSPSALAVAVTSTDQSQSRQVDIEIPDVNFAVTGLTGSVGDATINQPLPATYVPPTEVTIRSSGGGEATFPLEILGPGKTTQTPPTAGPIANAGADLGFDPANLVEIRTVITLNASASSGNIANFMWSPPLAGFEIDAVASQGSQLVGLVTAAGDLVFSVTVIDDAGRASTDSVIVHVTDSNQVQDVITVTAARYDLGRQLWDVTGDTNVWWDQRMDVYFALLDETGAVIRDVNGAPVKDVNRRIGSAFAGDLGLWRFRAPASIFRPEMIPTGLDTTVVVESALGGKASFVYRVSR